MQTDIGTGTQAGVGRDELVGQYLGLVDHIVTQIGARLPRHVAREDLVAAGRAGLLQAAETWRPDRGTPFATYAAIRIRGAVLDELRRTDWASRGVRRRSRRIEEAAERLRAATGTDPTRAQLAADAGVSVADLDGLEADLHRAVVLAYDALPGGAESAALPLDLHTPEAALLERERQAYLADAIELLPERLRRVVVGYFFEDRPMQELAEELGVTDSRISQMRALALSMLRDGLNAQLDPDAPREEVSRRAAKLRAQYCADIARYRSHADRLRGRAGVAAAV